MSRVSGSSLDRAAACPASVALSGVFDPAGFAAARGSAIHAFVYNARKHGRERALFMAPAELRDFCAAIDLDELKRYLTPNAVGEAAYVFNALTGEVRFLGENIERRYPERRPGDIPFSIDWSDEQDDEVCALDIKTGKTELPPPGEGWQWRLAGVALARHFGLDNSRLIKATLDEDARWWFDEYEATVLDLDAWAGELKATAQQIEDAHALVAAGRTPDVRTGSHCDWCPAIKSCPSTTGLVRRIVPELQALQDTMREMTVEQLGAGWPVYQQMLRLVKAIGEEYDAVLRTMPLPLPNGKRLVMVEQAREYIKPDVALSVLVERFGADAAQRATKASVSKESLKAAVGRDQFDKAMECIRAAGGVDVKVSLTPKEEKVR